MSVYRNYGQKQTHQQIPVPGRTDQVENRAGGYVFKLDLWKQLDRFLILGNEANSYYANKEELMFENVKCLAACVDADPQRTIARIVEVSDAGLAIKNEPALFALAFCAAPIHNPDNATRKLAMDVLPQVARTGTHLLHFVAYLDNLAGWGRVRQTGVQKWFTEKKPADLAYQVVKYQSRDQWAMADVLRLARPTPPDAVYDAIFKWVVDGWEDETFAAPPEGLVDSVIYGFELAKRAPTEAEVIDAVVKYRLPWEALPTQHLKSPEVWAALLSSGALPLTAMLRNLGRMTSIGLLEGSTAIVELVTARLVNQEYIQKSRLHPFAVLVGATTYAAGKGVRGSLTWSPNVKINAALNETFYLAFQNVVPAGKRFMLCLDVSGSMSWEGSLINNTHIHAREAAAAMAMVTFRTEPETHVMAFSRRLHEADLKRDDDLDTVVHKINRMGAGGTDCSLPMVVAKNDRKAIDTFVVYTDNETWAGNIHPFQALKQYRDAMGIDARLIVVGMVATQFSIADPTDGGMLDVVGFDTSAPKLISDFAGERF